MSYSYPIDETWSQKEIVNVVNFFTLIEKAYETKVQRQDVLAVYRRFKEIVPSKSEEKKIFAAFQKSSGYSAYHVVKQARESDAGIIKM